MAAESPPNWKPMTFALVLGVGGLAACSVLFPESLRPWNFAAIGAVSLFAAARLRFVQSVIVLAAMLAVKDLCIFAKFGWQPEPLSWFAFLGYAAIGYAFLRKTENPAAIGGGAVAASLVFFVVSNFGSWLMQALPYGYSLAGLADCYQAAIPFYRGTLVSDVLCTATLFAAHAVLSRAWFPAERLQPATVVSNEETW
ncbi:MAG: DUF6580 family putative transport protein [Gemmataceae bacterium]